MAFSIGIAPPPPRPTCGLSWLFENPYLCPHDPVYYSIIGVAVKSIRYDKLKIAQIPRPTTYAYKQAKPFMKVLDEILFQKRG